MTSHWWLLPVVALVLLSGCLVADEPLEQEIPDMPGPERPAPKPPANLSATDVVLGATDLPSAGGYACDQMTSYCKEYAFTVGEGVWYMDARLEWMVSTNDFDLYLFERNHQHAAAADFIPSTIASISGLIDPGAYEFVVVGYLVPADEYTLTVTFDTPV